MIRIKLCELMGREKMTRKRLAELTGVRPNTIGDLYKENVRKIDLQALDKICTVFKCDISDILEFIPDDKTQENEDIS